MVLSRRKSDEKAEHTGDSDLNVLVSELKWESPQNQSRTNVSMHYLVEWNYQSHF